MLGAPPCAIEDPAHIQAMLDKRPGARPIKLRDRIAVPLHRRSPLPARGRPPTHRSPESEIKKLERLVFTYGEADIAAAFTRALRWSHLRRTLRAGLCRSDPASARGQGEPRRARHHR